jgi:hypothetical protein
MFQKHDHEIYALHIQTTSVILQVNYLDFHLVTFYCRQNN